MPCQANEGPLKTARTVSRLGFRRVSVMNQYGYLQSNNAFFRKRIKHNEPRARAIASIFKRPTYLRRITDLQGCLDGVAAMVNRLICILCALCPLQSLLSTTAHRHRRRHGSRLVKRRISQRPRRVPAPRIKLSSKGHNETMRGQHQGIRV